MSYKIKPYEMEELLGIKAQQVTAALEETEEQLPVQRIDRVRRLAGIIRDMGQLVESLEEALLEENPELSSIN